MQTPLPESPNDEPKASEAGAADRPSEEPASTARLRAAQVAFDSGNYLLARELSTALAREEPDSEAADSARQLLAQTEPHPHVRVLLLITTLLLIAVTLFAYLNGGS